MSERWTPHATVATVIEHDGKYLLVKENKPEGIVYNQPAGHIEAGESISEAAIRETLEETRWEASLDHLIGIYVYTAPINGVTYHRYCFAASPVQHNAGLNLDDDIIDAEWLSWEEVCNADNLRSPLVKKCIEDYRAGKRYPLNLIYEHSDDPEN